LGAPPLSAWASDTFAFSSAQTEIVVSAYAASADQPAEITVQCTLSDLEFCGQFAAWNTLLRVAPSFNLSGSGHRAGLTGFRSVVRTGGIDQFGQDSGDNAIPQVIQMPVTGVVERCWLFSQFLRCLTQYGPGVEIGLVARLELRRNEIVPPIP
tara:strand:- start:799 stop:1260 length:462 start_codon:yes stop_codon:yes gene_type:complete